MRRRPGPGPGRQQHPQPAALSDFSPAPYPRALLGLPEVPRCARMPCQVNVSVSPGSGRPAPTTRRRAASRCKSTAASRIPQARSADLTVGVDHDTGHSVWAAPGRDSRHVPAVLSSRSRRSGFAMITNVSADGAPYISTRRAGQVPERGPLRRSVPHRRVGHRCLGCVAAHGDRQNLPDPPSRRSPGSRTVRARHQAGQAGARSGE